MPTTAVLFVLVSAGLVAQQPTADPETVMVTLRVKPGGEGAVAEVLTRHWQTARALGLVRDTPHVTIRGAEGDRPYFIDIFTWRDASAPDNAPASIRAIWDEMNRLVERREGKPGLEITEVFPVTPVVR
jgi:hypothetical protein